MKGLRSVQRVAQLTGILLRLGLLTPEEEKDIREKIEQLEFQERRKQR